MTASSSSLSSSSAYFRDLEKLRTYAAMGFHLAPTYPTFIDTDTEGTTTARCGCGDSKCHPKLTGKHPRIKWKEGATNDIRQIEEWHSRWPNSGWAVHLGKSGLVCVDVDPRNGGDVTLADWVATNGQLPPTMSEITHSLGSHDFYRAPDNFPAHTCLQLAPGLELLSGNHLVFIDPTIGRTMRPYRNNFAQPTACPENLIAAAQAAFALVEEKRTVKEAIDLDRMRSQYVPSYLSPSFDSEAIKERCRKYLDKMPESIEGQYGSDRLYHAAHICGNGFDLPEIEALDCLFYFNETKCVPPWSAGDIKKKLTDAYNNATEKGYLLNKEWSPDRQRERERDAEGSWVPDDFVDTLMGPYRTKKETAESSTVESSTDNQSTDNQLADNQSTDNQSTDHATTIEAAGTDGASELSPQHQAWRAAYDAQKEREEKVAKKFYQQNAKTLSSCHHKVFCVSRWVKGLARVKCVLCKSWQCSNCSSIKKDLWKKHTNKKLAGLKRVFVGTIDGEGEGWEREWNRIRKAVADKHRGAGEFFRVRRVGPDGGNEYFIVATVRFSPSCEEIPGSEAAIRIRRVIDALPLCRKPISRSKGWRLEEPEATNEWRRIGAIGSHVKVSTIEDVLTRRGLEHETKFPSKNPWIFLLVQFNFPKEWEESDIDALHQDLKEGRVMPSDDIDLSGLWEGVRCEGGEGGNEASYRHNDRRNRIDELDMELQFVN